jgi:hypothetical protein
MSKMTIVDLPGDRWMVVLSEMPDLPHIVDPAASDATPADKNRAADWHQGRQYLLDAGASAVLRFGYPVEVGYVQLRKDVDPPSDD